MNGTLLQRKPNYTINGYYLSRIGYTDSIILLIYRLDYDSDILLYSKLPRMGNNLPALTLLLY